MRTMIYRTCLLLAMALLLLYSCASVPKSLTSEDQGKIRSVILETVLEDDQANILDISQIRKQEYSKTYGGMMYGAIGGALESLIKEGISRYKINSLVGGSIDPIRESISGYDTKAVFDDLVLRGISQNMRQLNEVHNLRILDVRVMDRSISDQQSRTDTDVLLKIEYQYGIGAYAEKKPLPAIIAKISVESLPEKRTLMKNTWIAHSCEKNDYTLDDYAKDNGKIYKQCFGEIAEQFGRNLVNIFF